MEKGLKVQKNREKWKHVSNSPNFGTAEWYQWKWYIETFCQPRMCFLCFINFQIEHTSRSRAGRNFWLGRVFSQVNLKILRTWRWTKLTCSKCSKHFNQDESSQFFVYLSKYPYRSLQNLVHFLFKKYGQPLQLLALRPPPTPFPSSRMGTMYISLQPLRSSLTLLSFPGENRASGIW